MDFNLSSFMNCCYKLLFIFLAGCLICCEKPLDAAYEQDARVYFFERQNDLVSTRITTKSYSFLLLPSTQTRDTVYVKIKTMGIPADYDRFAIGKTVQEGTDATEGVDYDFIPGLIPAGAIEGNLPIVLYRNDKIKSQELTLNLTIGETADFKGGVVEDNLFTYRWSDKLSKPANWSSPQYFGIDNYFGSYSDVKYRFIIDVLGIAEFPVTTCARCPYDPALYTHAAMMDFKAHMVAALEEYNAAHPGNPLRDENGNLITF